MAKQTFKFLPLSIRLETLGGVATPLVPRGTPLPATRSEKFSTAVDQQSAVEIKLVMGERPLVDKNLEVGTFHLRGIPPAKRGEPQIQVEFSVDSSCLIKARASLKAGQLFSEQTFSPPNQLTPNFVSTKLEEAESNRSIDEFELQRVESINDAHSLIARAEQQLGKGSNAAISKAIADLGLALDVENLADIQRKTATLNTELEAAYSQAFSSGLFQGFNFSDLIAPQKPARQVPQQKKSTSQPSLSKKGAHTSTGQHSPPAHPLPLNPPGEYEYHPEIARVSDKLLSEGNFRQAVLDAFIHVIARVKERTGLQNEGEDLMNRAFSPDNRIPPVRFNTLRNEADKSEQRGIWNLFKGVVGLRNFKAHIVTAFDNPHRAHEYLALASLLMRLLDNATVDNAPSQLLAPIPVQATKSAQRPRLVEIIARGTGPEGPTLSKEASIHQGLTALSSIFTVITYTTQPIRVTAKRLLVDGTELNAELFFQMKSRAKDASIIMRGNDWKEYRFCIRMATKDVPAKRPGIVEFEIEGHDKPLTVNVQFPA